MKRVIMLLTVALSSMASVFSQTRSEETNSYVNAFEADSVVWKSCMDPKNPGDIPRISETIMYGDTLVNDKKWKIVNITYAYLPSAKGLLRTENRKVYFLPYPGFEENYWFQEERVLFDFSMEIGDYLNEYVIVSSIDSIELNDGRNHKRIRYRGVNSLLDDDYWSYLDIIEGLGSIHHDPFGLLLCNQIEIEWRTFLCCNVDGNLLYMNPAYSNCEGTKVANEIIEYNNLKPTVVFADGNLHVKFNDDTLFDVTVFNMEGMMLLQNKNNRKEMLVNLENLPKGIYIVRINSGSFFYSEKIVK
jgi:hypothetical protein